MRLEVCLLITFNLAWGLRRGPHHPHGQSPVDQKHHHYKPRGADTLTGDSELLHDARASLAKTTLGFHLGGVTVLYECRQLRSSIKYENRRLLAGRHVPRRWRFLLSCPPGSRHIEEDSKVLTAEALASMTPEELEFHYFSAHDFDKNSKLDGLELLKAVYHTIEHEAADPDADSSIEPESNDLETYIALVDRTLESDDTDGDGFVSYAEYRAARANQSDRTLRVIATK